MKKAKREEIEEVKKVRQDERKIHIRRNDIWSTELKKGNGNGKKEIRKKKRHIDKW